MIYDLTKWYEASGMNDRKVRTVEWANRDFRGWAYEEEIDLLTDSRRIVGNYLKAIGWRNKPMKLNGKTTRCWEFFLERPLNEPMVALGTSGNPTEPITLDLLKERQRTTECIEMWFKEKLVRDSHRMLILDHLIMDFNEWTNGRCVRPKESHFIASMTNLKAKKKKLLGQVYITGVDWRGIGDRFEIVTGKRVFQ